MATVHDLEALEAYSRAAQAWMSAHGVLMEKSSSGVSQSLQHAPFSLYPSKFPRGEFIKAHSIQEDMNTLVDKISKDVPFLNAHLKGAAEVDTFTGNLLRILNTVHEEGLAQPIRFNLLRSDYMLDTQDDVLAASPEAVVEAKIKQVEVNTISVSFASLGTHVNHMHSYMQDRYKEAKVDDIPTNHALEGLAGGLAEAWGLYGKKEQVLTARLIRRSLEDVASRGAIDAQSKILTIDGYEVAVAYFRAGYMPEHYPADLHWAARLLIERSLSIKCPDVGSHLAGAKKIQQVLADREVLARYIPASHVEPVLEVFTGLYPVTINSPVVADAISRPHKFVLKPQREGGGNNLYMDDLKKELTTMTQEDCKKYILMDRIIAPQVAGLIVRDNMTIPTQLVGELGIFGVMI
eukprot:Ihof_evm3s142 gene=Ihof_evmTU3s142